MDLENIDSVVESLLFLSGNGIKTSELCDMLDIQKSELNQCIKRLNVKYNQSSGIILLNFNNTLQFVSNPINKIIVENVLLPVKQKELTKSALETVAIIAYKQPITKLEIEQIRGVNCDYAIQILVKYSLIEIVGQKDSVGKPLLFGTTDEFLRHFNLNSIKDLPDYYTLIAMLEELEVTKPIDASLYHEFELKPEEIEHLKGEEINIIE